MEIIAVSRVTCPECGHAEELSMPTDHCQFFINAWAAEPCSKREKGLAVFFARMAMSLARRCRLKRTLEENDAVKQREPSN